MQVNNSISMLTTQRAMSSAGKEMSEAMERLAREQEAAEALEQTADGLVTPRGRGTGPSRAALEGRSTGRKGEERKRHKAEEQEDEDLKDEEDDDEVTQWIKKQLAKQTLAGIKKLGEECGLKKSLLSSLTATTTQGMLRLLCLARVRFQAL